jgi:hypothetical protein
MAQLPELPVRPMGAYPGRPTTARRSANFKVTPGAALTHLRQELQRAGALRAVLEVDCDPYHVKQDGQLRSDARLRSPAVVVSYEHPTHGMLRFPCDSFDNWTDNIRAIGLSLEALRAVERYGVVRRAEQFLGFKALPSSTTPTMTTQAAADALSAEGQRLAAQILSNRETYEQARALARKHVHPDARAGEREAWDRIEAACVVLDAFWGIRR